MISYNISVTRWRQKNDGEDLEKSCVTPSVNTKFSGFVALPNSVNQYLTALEIVDWIQKQICN